MTKNNRDKKQLPIAKKEDVEFSRDLADLDDFEAQRRAKKADKRAQVDE